MDYDYNKDKILDETYELEFYDSKDESSDSGAHEDDDEDEDDDDEESPTYLLNKKRVLDQEIAKFSKYVYKFIPMVDKFLF